MGKLNAEDEDSKANSSGAESAIGGHRRPFASVVRRVSRKKITDANSTAQMDDSGEAAQPAAGRMVVDVSKLKLFRGFTHTPEEGRQLAKVSFTDTPLLRKIRRGE